jgi:hypothetical protein
MVALSDRLKDRARRTFAIVSDGELEEGQVWEAAMFAAHHRLRGLTMLLDANNSQVDGPVDTITTIEPIAAKREAFGWDAVDLDGTRPPRPRPGSRDPAPAAATPPRPPRPRPGRRHSPADPGDYSPV